MEKVREIVREGRRVAKEDPRRVVHSFKVGLVLALVSSFYYYQPLYDSFGVNAMWAVMTVVVVFEFSVGATLGKGFNRVAATLFAGALGIGAHHLASMSSATGEPILLAIFVFVQAALSTFVRFFPRVKARYDYSLLIFILTFALISVSGFREEQVLMLTHKRISTVIIGGLSCVLISIFVCPVWAGQDLHSLLASNLEKLSFFLLDFGDKYCEAVGNDDTKEVDKRKKDFDNYKSVLNSKSNEESLANFAKWEPGHGQFRFRHPWKQYLALGELIRQCAYRIHALNSYLNADDTKVPVDIKHKLREPLKRMSLESGKAMKEMSMSLKKMTKPSSCDIHVQNARSACKSLTNLLNSGILKEVEPLELISLLTAISLLIDIINLTEKILESLHELASAAKFKDKIERPLSFEKTNAKSIVCVRPIKCQDDHVITIIEDDGNNDDTSKNDNCSKEVSNREKYEGSDTHVHIKCVSCGGHTCLCDVVECSR
ncbi:PREDICTED: aluminum-activated malate transporter 7-like [Camelina sativa]|uniref:Aluminum-activated malate transporter 7-like n=1 Tax=Camelina sativa TaxID=90675 RepID=A0ABM0WM86_CAMSA|nr:PREDICTED: aluminum-activated malate transporter 7-like [Camelina sativa]